MGYIYSSNQPDWRIFITIAIRIKYIPVYTHK